MEEWKYWIALKMVQGVGEVLFRNLLAKFPSPKSIFEAKLSELERVEGIGEKIAKEIKGFKDWNKADEEVRKIKKFGFKLLLLKDQTIQEIFLIRTTLLLFFTSKVIFFLKTILQLRLLVLEFQTVTEDLLRRGLRKSLPLEVLIL